MTRRLQKCDDVVLQLDALKELVLLKPEQQVYLVCHLVF